MGTSQRLRLPRRLHVVGSVGLAALLLAVVLGMAAGWGPSGVDKWTSMGGAERARWAS